METDWKYIEINRIQIRSIDLGNQKKSIDFPPVSSSTAPPYPDRTYIYCAAMHPRLYFIQVLVTCLSHRAVATDEIQLLAQLSQALLEILGCPVSMRSVLELFWAASAAAAIQSPITFPQSLSEVSLPGNPAGAQPATWNVLIHHKWRGWLQNRIGLAVSTDWHDCGDHEPSLSPICCSLPTRGFPDFDRFGNYIHQFAILPWICASVRQPTGRSCAGSGATWHTTTVAWQLQLSFKVPVKKDREISAAAVFAVFSSGIVWWCLFWECALQFRRVP